MTNEDILLKIEADKKRQQLYNTATPTRERARLFDDVSYTTGFGQLYDKTLSGNYEMKFQNYLGLEGNEDRLAKQQSGWEQVSNGLWKNLGKTLLIGADSINTFTYGLYSAISDGKLQSLWDNDVSNYLDDASKRLDRDFANYYTDEEKSKGFFGRMFTNPANFLANDVAGGLAFIGGAVLPELALGVLTGGASMPASFAKMGARLGLKSADNIVGAGFKEGVEQTVKKGAKQATRKEFKDGFSALLRSNTGKKAGDVANFARFIGQSTFFEAGMEARHSFHDSIDSFINDYQQREGRLPSQEELTDYIGDASKAADYVFGANVALLSVTNAAMFGKLFNLPSLNLETKIGKTFGIDVTKLPTGKLAIKNATKAQKVAGNVYFIGKKPFSEGVVEEGLQGVFGGTMDNYLSAKYDPNQTDVSLLNSFGEALKDQYTTKEGWFEIGIGAIIGAIGGNISGDFGVEGFGKKGYSGARKNLEGNINTYNEGTTRALEGKTDPEVRTLKNLMRTNSVGNYKADTPAFQDTIVSYNYIKANEALKGYVNTVEDFNTAVDAVVFTPEQMQNFGFKTEADLNGYKASLKENFAKDYEIYQEVETIVDNLQIPNYKEGELSEFRDAVAFSLMAGKKAGTESEKIARNISEMTGINGIYDAMKFSQEMDMNFDSNIQTLKEKQTRLEQLKNEILDVGQRIQDSKGNENLYKENTKKHLLLAQEIKKLTDETIELESVLDNDFKAMQAEITFTPQQMSTTGIKDIMDSMSNLESYISALEKTGRTTEAKNLKTLLEQFNLYSSAEINAVNTIRRMSETNFYSSKEGKEFLNKVKGDDYSMSESARKEIKDSEEEVRNILIKNGFEFDNASEQIEEALKKNENLSERQKFKAESMLRATLAYRRIQDLVGNAQEEATTAEQSVEEDFFQEGDTIRIAQRLQGVDLTNPESINELIKKITNEIDVIVNKPTAESLREIKAKEAEIEQLRQQIIDLQNQPVQEQEEVTSEQQETISDEDYTNFVDNGVVSSGIIYSIANKVKNNEPLTERETAIFTDKTSEINERIVELNTETEFGSPEMAEKIKEQTDSLTEEEIDEVINEIEQEDDTTRENGTDIGGETITDTDGANREDVQQETVETTQPINATSDIENQIQEITQSIQKLEDEISDLRTPFKFMESEGYIRYNALLQKRINEGQLSPQEEEELANLENSIDQWITISGVRVQGIELSDLVKQLQALENIIMSDPVDDTKEIEEEEVDEDARQSEDSVRNNYDVGLSYNGVVSRRKKDSVIVSNVSLETLEEVSGVSLQGREGVTISETGGLQLSNEIVREINEVGKIVILNPAYDEVSSYYSLVLQSIPNPTTGVLELYPIQSDYDYVRDAEGNIMRDSEGNPLVYQDGVVSPDTIYQAVKSETILFKIDPRQPYNRDLLNELRNEMGITKPLTEEELRKEVDEIVQQKARENSTIKKVQSEIAQLQTEQAREKLTTTKQARLNTLEQKLKDHLKELRVKAEQEISKRKEKKPKKPSETIIKKLTNKLRIMVVNEEGDNLQILKGIRTGEGYEGTNPHFEALRTKLASNPKLLLDLIEANNFETYDEGVTISKIFMGLPNYNYVRTADGTTVRQYKPIVKEDLSKIEDIGYISDGKLQLRSGKTDNVNTDFVKTALNRKSKEKSPVIVIRKGNHLIVYPVKVGRNESPIDLEMFKSIYESETFSAVDKAIKLNTMLAQAGIDVKQKGNAFVVVGDNMLNDDFFNNIFARLTEKEYIRNVDSWTDSKQSIEDALLNNASANIRFSDPFISPKVKFDFSSVEVQEIPETKKTSTKKAVIDNKQSVLKKYRCKY